MTFRLTSPLPPTGGGSTLFLRKGLSPRGVPVSGVPVGNMRGPIGQVRSLRIIFFLTWFYTRRRSNSVENPSVTSGPVLDLSFLLPLPVSPPL